LTLLRMPIEMPANLDTMVRPREKST
jgi:hypothetical protein